MKKKILKRIAVTMAWVFILTSISCFNVSNAAGAGPKKVVGTFTEWSVYAAHNQYKPSDIPWDKITHLNYAYAKTSFGKIAIFDEWAATGIAFGESLDSPYTGTYGQIRKLKSQHPNVPVLISVGGLTASGDFHAISATELGRTTFADSCVDFIRKYSFDGVDIDWQYPGVFREPDKISCANDTGNPAGPEDRHNFTLLLQKIRGKLDAAAAVDGKKYLLSAHIPVLYYATPYQEAGLYQQYLDYVNLDAFDMHGHWDNLYGHSNQYSIDNIIRNAGHHAPLFKNSNEPDWDKTDSAAKEKMNIHWAVNEYRQLGIPATKIVMGISLVSRGWSGVEAGTGQNRGLFMPTSGGAPGIWDGGYAAGLNPYYHTKANIGTNPAFSRCWDIESNAAYLYSESLKQLYTYEDETSIGAKLNYIRQNSLGGANIWELSADYPSKGSTLTQQIYKGLEMDFPLPICVTGFIKPDHLYAEQSASKVLSGFEVKIRGDYTIDYGTNKLPGTDVQTAYTNEKGQFTLYLRGGISKIEVSKPNYLKRTIITPNMPKNPYETRVGFMQIKTPIEIWVGDMEGSSTKDGAINMSDLMAVVEFYNTALGDGKYNESADLDKDNAINMQDILVIVNHFNTTSESYPPFTVQ
ncbi:MAG: glycosyl hydrolase family 18 protein [Clostridia bacterium]|nr:glycosyl hydrolase family 18 protein [Clostridia bacterium]